MPQKNQTDIMKTQEKRKTLFEELQGTTDEIIRQVKRLIKEGNARRLMIINKKGKILFQSQLTAGLAGSTLLTLMAPIVSAIGMFALVMNDVKVVVEKYPAEQQDEDEFEVEAEVIIEVEDNEQTETPDPEQPKNETEKTVGRDKSEE